MACNTLKLKGFEVFGSSFQDRRFTFTNRDISLDTFEAIVYSPFAKLFEVEGVVSGNEVFFSYSQLETLKQGYYRIEFWAEFNEIGRELIAIDDFTISSDPQCVEVVNETNFQLDFNEEVIDFTMQYALFSNQNVSWDNISDKPTVFYDDTEIKYELQNKVDKVDGYGLSENNFSDANLNKLENLQNFDPTDINNALGNKVDKVANKGLSTNDYTTAEKNKLAGLDGNKFFGKFADETALSAVVGIIGGYAYVGGVGRNDESYIWDDDDLKWVKSNNIPTAETPASVKAKYESNPDTNAFTNARRDKLEGINLSLYSTLGGNQTFTGVNVFNQSISVPNATSNNHSVNLGQIISDFVPYTGATKDLKLGARNISATRFQLVDGSSAHYITRIADDYDVIGISTGFAVVNWSTQAKYIAVESSGLFRANFGIKIVGTLDSTLYQEPPTDLAYIQARFYNTKPKSFTPVLASTIANNTIFVDIADGKLKFKDGSGVVNNLY